MVVYLHSYCYVIESIVYEYNPVYPWMNKVKPQILSVLYYSPELLGRINTQKASTQYIVGAQLRLAINFIAMQIFYWTHIDLFLIWSLYSYCSTLKMPTWLYHWKGPIHVTWQGLVSHSGPETSWANLIFFPGSEIWNSGQQLGVAGLTGLDPLGEKFRNNLTKGLGTLRFLACDWLFNPICHSRDSVFLESYTQYSPSTSPFSFY